jgi:prevent-host-death family protein
MSSAVNVTQLRQNLPEYLKQVREGREVEVTVHGKVVARLVPEAAKGAREEEARRASQDRKVGGCDGACGRSLDRRP